MFSWIISIEFLSPIPLIPLPFICHNNYHVPTEPSVYSYCVPKFKLETQKIGITSIRINSGFIAVFFLFFFSPRYYYLIRSKLTIDFLGHVLLVIRAHHLPFLYSRRLRLSQQSWVIHQPDCMINNQRSCILNLS